MIEAVIIETVVQVKVSTITDHSDRILDMEIGKFQCFNNAAMIPFAATGIRVPGP